MTVMTGMIDLNLASSPQLADTEKNHEVFEELWRIYMALNSINEHYTYTQYGLPGSSNASGANSPYHTSPRLPVRCVETIPQGKLVHLSSVAGELQATLADASDLNKWANAVSATPGVPNGIIYVALRTAMLYGFAGLTTNANYFLGSAGGVTLSPPATGIIQPVGIATSGTSLYYEYHSPAPA